MAPSRGNGPRSIEALATQVHALESDYQRLDSKIDSLFSNLSTRFDAAISGIHTKIDARSQPQYALLVSVVGLAVAIIVGIGGFAYSTINTGTLETKGAIESLRNNAVSQREFTAFVDRQLKLDDTFTPIRTSDALDRDLRELRNHQVTRDEHQREWHSFEVQHQDLKDRVTREVAEVQRQIDDLQARDRSTYNVRDVISDLKHNQDEMWRLLRKGGERER